jgi:energy-coupling factor transporter ATP-binding protein EcfA2
MLSSEECYAEFNKLQSELRDLDLSKHSEADTRAKVIDRMLTKVLNWPEANIAREPHTDTGFIDYKLSTQRPTIVLEAKKSGDTFLLPLDLATTKTLTVGGVIRSVRNVKDHIDQAISYCASDGIPFAVVSNGMQWLIFVGSRTDGEPISKGRLLVYRSLSDIHTRFLEFWSLLSYAAVVDNSLKRALLPDMSGNTNYRRIVDELHHRNDKVTRNILGTALAPIIQQYMGEIAGDDTRDLLRHLFVNSKSLRAMFQEVAHSISLELSKTISGAENVAKFKEVTDLRASAKGRIAKSLNIKNRGEVILLLGRVGSGKTTFVDHFIRVEAKKQFKDHIVVSLDFRDLILGGDIKQFFFDKVRHVLSRNERFAGLVGKNLRKIFAAEIRELTLGPLAYIAKTNNKKYEDQIAQLLQNIYTDTARYYSRSLNYLADKLGVRCLLVFDNVDQLDFKLQQDIFAFAHAISVNTHAISLLTMWEETFVRSKRSGILATYPTGGYHLPPVSVVDIISRRLTFIVDELMSNGLSKQMLPNPNQADKVAAFLKIVNSSIMHDRKHARFFLESIAMGNLRRAMEIFSSFLVSGHTDAGKILAIGRYYIPLHEFIKSIGLGDNRNYQSELSPILNLFSISDESKPSHFTKVRILELLYFKRNRSDASFGAGFFRTSDLKKSLEIIGTSESDVMESLKLLSTYALIENDIYDAKVISEAYRITPAGRYYIRYLALRFAYLDLVLQDTPICDSTTFEGIKSLGLSHDMEDRFKRVATFLDYLQREEDKEYVVVMSKSDSIPLRNKFVPSYRGGFTSDMTLVRQKLHRRNGAESHATDYQIVDLNAAT